MTLIVGIRCSDGVVVGADGAATLGNVGVRTVRQPVKKLALHAGRLIVGVSGPVGLAQRYQGEIRALWDGNGLAAARAYAIGPVISERLRRHLSTELHFAASVAPILGNQLAASSALATAIVALPSNEVPILLQFDQNGAPEEATSELPFVAIGSGGPNADSFLAFLRRVFWPDRPPTVQEGTFAALWTLQHAIAVDTGGVAEPIQVATLDRDRDGLFVAREISEPELAEHREAITAAEQSLRSFRAMFSASAERPSGVVPAFSAEADTIPQP